MSGKAKQDTVVAAADHNDWSSTSESSGRLFAPIIAGCALFHRSYSASRCAAGMTSHPWHLSLFRFWP
jgi:hypothetical protein